MTRILIVLLASYLLIGCYPKENGPVVSKVYPTADTLPENLLRIYVQFPAPMKTVGGIEKIKILNDKGVEIEGAIFNNVHELWDTEQQQLTLIFDPARVKTGLRAHESFGRALQPKKTYQLVIKGLEDIAHRRMTTPFIKEFYVTYADTISPDIDRWEIHPPPVRSKEPLKISFPFMADQMSLRQRLVVIDEKEELIEGDIAIGKEEKEWSFAPTQSWARGEYFVLVNARFADPSGNNLNGQFDHAPGSLKYNVEDTVLRLSFFVGD